MDVDFTGCNDLNILNTTQPDFDDSSLPPHIPSESSVSNIAPNIETTSTNKTASITTLLSLIPITSLYLFSQTELLTLIIYSIITNDAYGTHLIDKYIIKGGKVDDNILAALDTFNMGFPNLINELSTKLTIPFSSSIPPTEPLTPLIDPVLIHSTISPLISTCLIDSPSITFLIFSSILSADNIIAHLLTLHADPLMICPHTHRTPLHWVCSTSNWSQHTTNCVKLLIAYLSGPTSSSHISSLDTKDINNLTPLSYLLLSGQQYSLHHFNSLKRFVNAGSQLTLTLVKIPSNFSTWTTLYPMPVYLPISNSPSSNNPINNSQGYDSQLASLTENQQYEQTSANTPLFTLYPSLNITLLPLISTHQRFSSSYQRIVQLLMDLKQFTLASKITSYFISPPHTPITLQSPCKIQTTSSNSISISHYPKCASYQLSLNTSQSFPTSTSALPHYYQHDFHYTKSITINKTFMSYIFQFPNVSSRFLEAFLQHYPDLLSYLRTLLDDKIHNLMHSILTNHTPIHSDIIAIFQQYCTQLFTPPNTQELRISALSQMLSTPTLPTPHLFLLIDQLVFNLPMNQEHTQHMCFTKASTYSIHSSLPSNINPSEKLQLTTQDDHDVSQQNSSSFFLSQLKIQQSLDYHPVPIHRPLLSIKYYPLPLTKSTEEKKKKKKGTNSHTNNAISGPTSLSRSLSGASVPVSKDTNSNLATIPLNTPHSSAITTYTPFIHTIPLEVYYFDPLTPRDDLSLIISNLIKHFQTFSHLSPSILLNYTTNFSSNCIAATELLIAHLKSGSPSSPLLTYLFSRNAVVSNWSNLSISGVKAISPLILLLDHYTVPLYTALSNKIKFPLTKSSSQSIKHVPCTQSETGIPYLSDLVQAVQLLLDYKCSLFTRDNNNLSFVYYLLQNSTISPCDTLQILQLAHQHGYSCYLIYMDALIWLATSSSSVSSSIHQTIPPQAQTNVSFRQINPFLPHTSPYKSLLQTPIVSYSSFLVLLDFVLSHGVDITLTLSQLEHFIQDPSAQCQSKAIAVKLSTQIPHYPPFITPLTTNTYSKKLTQHPSSSTSAPSSSQVTLSQVNLDDYDAFADDSDDHLNAEQIKEIKIRDAFSAPSEPPFNPSSTSQHTSHITSQQAPNSIFLSCLPEQRINRPVLKDIIPPSFYNHQITFYTTSQASNTLFSTSIRDCSLFLLFLTCGSYISDNSQQVFDTLICLGFGFEKEATCHLISFVDLVFTLFHSAFGAFSSGFGIYLFGLLSNALISNEYSPTLTSNLHQILVHRIFPPAGWLSVHNSLPVTITELPIVSSTSKHLKTILFPPFSPSQSSSVLIQTSFPWDAKPTTTFFERGQEKYFLVMLQLYFTFFIQQQYYYKYRNRQKNSGFNLLHEMDHLNAISTAATDEAYNQIRLAHYLYLTKSPLLPQSLSKPVLLSFTQHFHIIAPLLPQNLVKQLSIQFSQFQTSYSNFNTDPNTILNPRSMSNLNILHLQKDMSSKQAERVLQVSSSIFPAITSSSITPSTPSPYTPTPLYLHQFNLDAIHHLVLPDLPLPLSPPVRNTIKKMPLYIDLSSLIHSNSSYTTFTVEIIKNIAPYASSFIFTCCQQHTSTSLYPLLVAVFQESYYQPLNSIYLDLVLALLQLYSLRDTTIIQDIIASCPDLQNPLSLNDFFDQDDHIDSSSTNIIDPSGNISVYSKIEINLARLTQAQLTAHPLLQPVTSLQYTSLIQTLLAYTHTLDSKIVFPLLVLLIKTIPKSHLFRNFTLDFVCNTYLTTKSTYPLTLPFLFYHELFTFSNMDISLIGDGPKGKNGIGKNSILSNMVSQHSLSQVTMGDLSFDVTNPTSSAAIGSLKKDGVDMSKQIYPSTLSSESIVTQRYGRVGELNTLQLFLSRCMYEPVLSAHLIFAKLLFPKLKYFFSSPQFLFDPRLNSSLLTYLFNPILHVVNLQQGTHHLGINSKMAIPGLPATFSATSLPKHLDPTALSQVLFSSTALPPLTSHTSSLILLFLSSVAVQPQQQATTTFFRDLQSKLQQSFGFSASSSSLSFSSSPHYITSTSPPVSKLTSQSHHVSFSSNFAKVCLLNLPMLGIPTFFLLTSHLLNNAFFTLIKTLVQNGLDLHDNFNPKFDPLSTLFQQFGGTNGTPSLSQNHTSHLGNSFFSTGYLDQDTFETKHYIASNIRPSPELIQDVNKTQEYTVLRLFLAQKSLLQVSFADILFYLLSSGAWLYQYSIMRQIYTLSPISTLIGNLNNNINLLPNNVLATPTTPMTPMTPMTSLASVSSPSVSAMLLPSQRRKSQAGLKPQPTPQLHSHTAVSTHSTLAIATTSITLQNTVTNIATTPAKLHPLQNNSPIPQPSQQYINIPLSPELHHFQFRCPSPEISTSLINSILFYQHFSLPSCNKYPNAVVALACHPNDLVRQVLFGKTSFNEGEMQSFQLLSLSEFFSHREWVLITQQNGASSAKGSIIITPNQSFLTQSTPTTTTKPRSAAKSTSPQFTAKNGDKTISQHNSSLYAKNQSNLREKAKQEQQRQMAQMLKSAQNTENTIDDGNQNNNNNKSSNDHSTFQQVHINFSLIDNIPNFSSDESVDVDTPDRHSTSFFNSNYTDTLSLSTLLNPTMTPPSTGLFWYLLQFAQLNEQDLSSFLIECQTNPTLTSSISLTRCNNRNENVLFHAILRCPSIFTETMLFQLLSHLGDLNQAIQHCDIYGRDILHYLYYCQTHRFAPQFVAFIQSYISYHQAQQHSLKQQQLLKE